MQQLISSKWSDQHSLYAARTGSMSMSTHRIAGIRGRMCAYDSCTVKQKSVHLSTAVAVLTHSQYAHATTQYTHVPSDVGEALCALL
jgi:hypothetical protein